MHTENENADTGDEILDVVNDAVGEVTFTEEREENTDGNTESSSADDGGLSAVDGDATESEVSAGSESGSDETESEAASGESGESADEETDESEADAQGEDTDGDEAGADGEGAADEDGSDEDAGEPDHLNDPIPEGTNERTASRIQSLISDVKELSQTRDTFNEFQTAIEQSGASPEQYAASLGVLQAYNVGTPEQKRAAMQVLETMRRDLAMELGEADEYANVNDHPDLVAEIEAGSLSEERAREIAATRETKKYRDTVSKQQSEAQQQKQQTQQMVDNGKAELNSLGQELLADPAYKALYPQFTAILQSTLRRVHPTEWRATAEDTWRQLKAANPNITAPQPKPKPKQQPLRVKSGSSSGSKVAGAKSALDALDGALESM